MDPVSDEIIVAEQGCRKNLTVVNGNQSCNDRLLVRFPGLVLELFGKHFKELPAQPTLFGVRAKREHVRLY